MAGSELTIVRQSLYGVPKRGLWTPLSAYQNVMKSLNPAAWWQFTEPIGSLTVADSSGNGYTGTVTGNPLLGQAGPFAGCAAATFDESTTQITSAYTTSATTNLTLLCWMYCPPAGGRGVSLFVGNASSSNGYSMGIGNNGTFPYHVGGTLLQCAYDNVASLNTGIAINNGWNLCGFVVDSSGHPNAFVNGVQGYGPGASTPSAPTGTNTCIGNDQSISGGGSVLFGGRIAQPAIFASPLTAVQQLSLFRSVR